MMDDGIRLEDEDRDALTALSSCNSTPHPRKVHSLTQKILRSNQSGSNSHKQRQQIRNLSLDEISKSHLENCYYDSSEDEFYGGSVNAATVSAASADLDPGIDESLQAMPEFIGSGGGNGIFKSPTRAAVHPGRPPCIELRPHPLKETQVGRYLRTIGCTDNQLWAGQESGVRVWDLREIFEPGCGLGGRIRRGDEDAAPFHESANTTPTFVMVVDSANRLVWTGHKDGKIRSWKMDQIFNDSTPFKEGLSWQAHRGPVLSLAITSYGDLWSGSESGVIKIWPWEAVEKSLSLSPEERHMAALLVERSFIDLKAQVTVNGVCNISSQDIKCLLADNVRAKVWCATSMSISLWDSRTRDLKKVFNVEGQVENRVDMSSVHDQRAEDEIKVKFVSSTKKEKSQGFLQRSRNAIMGAADAVRRVATKGTGAFVEDARRTEASVLTIDGMIWTGCANGSIVQWDGNGNRLQEFNYHSSGVLCFCTFGTRIYVGYVSGTVQILDLEGNLIAGWIAHSSPVVKLAVGTGYIYSLASHGGIRGWNITSPGPLDNIVRSEVAAKEVMYTRRDNIKILIGTWNVGQGKPTIDSLKLWLGSASSDVGIVVVGLQEVEMGAGFLAMSAAKETVGQGLDGSAIGQLWIDTIGKTLDEGTTFERMGSRQLAGLLISLWVRKSIRTHVGDIDAGAVACGLGRTIGNKGGVGLRMRVYDRIMCFVNCHLAAHLEAVNRRNADFDHVFRNLVFSKSPNLLNNAAAGVSTSTQAIRGANTTSNKSAKPEVSEDVKPELSDADMVVFLGDFNYRLHSISYDEARDFVSQRCFDWLREKDQLRAEMEAGKVFQGMREAVIRFPPTYKFQRNTPGLGGYDSGEKKRIPAWCDRILYRDNRTDSVSECSLECPVVTSILQYDACMEVTESDHKPVRCKLYCQIAHVDRSVRRQELGEIIRRNDKINSAFDELRYVPESHVSTNSIILQNQETSSLRITNRSGAEKVLFQILCEGQSNVKGDEEQSDIRPRGSFGFPRWLEVTPAAGIIEPDRSVEVSVHHEEFHSTEEFVDGVPQNWWCEDTRDKEVILIVKIQGSCSTESKSHSIRVCHCFSAKTVRVDSLKSNRSSKKHQSGSVHRTEYGRLSNSSDVADDHRYLHSP